MSIFCTQHPILLRSKILDRVQFADKMKDCQSRLLLLKWHLWHGLVVETLLQILSRHAVCHSQLNLVGHQSFFPCAGNNQIAVELPHKIQ